MTTTDYRATTSRPSTVSGVPVTSPDAAATAIRDHAILHSLPSDREWCALVTLTTQHRMIQSHTVSIGSIDHTFMAPREILRLALLDNATAMVLAHNHPSGSTTPSADDIAVTMRNARASELIGVNLLDHLVVTGDPLDHWESLARMGHL